MQDDKLTDGPLSFLCRGEIEDVHLITGVWFIIRLNVYRELLYKRTGVAEKGAETGV